MYLLYFFIKNWVNSGYRHNMCLLIHNTCFLLAKFRIISRSKRDFALILKSASIIPTTSVIMFVLRNFGIYY